MRPGDEEKKLTVEITGKVSRIMFSGNNGFAIARVSDVFNDTTVKGCLPGIRIGETVHITGEEETHPKFGKQIKVTRFSQVQPRDAIGIARFFERVDGIGEKYASILAEHVLSLGEEPSQMEIAACPGIPSDLANAAARKWCTNRARNSQLVALQGFGLTTLQADRAVDLWGSFAVATVQENPYSLCKLTRVGFKLADEIAKSSFGVKHTDPRRIKQGILYCLKESMQSGGHTGLPRNDLLNESARILGIHKRQAEKPLVWLMDGGHLTEEHGLIFTPATAQAEQSLAERALALSKEQAYRFELEEFETDGLTDQQSEAVRYAMEEGSFLILTGGPGTGKTHTTTSIINAWRRRNSAVEVNCPRCNGGGCPACFELGYIIHGAGRPVYLAAPTGRAAKRMEEVSGCEAQTIHRLLKCRPAGDGFSFARELREIDGLVIIDEVSMLDTVMASTLLERISDRSTVVFVGDADQLPSIGPGYVLHDLISSGACKSVRLTQIHRQKAGSGIIRFAYAVQEGRQPDLSQAGDLKLIRVDGAEEAEKAVKACYDRLGSEDFRLPDGSTVNIFTDVQCLSPMKKAGRPGTAESINDVVQSGFYSPQEPHVDIFGTRFFVGDRVMQTANNYETYVYNGDIGSVVDVTPTAAGEDTAAVIEFDGTEVPYTRSDLATQVSRAYCCTIHKSQGSEYPVVILVITGSHHYMLERTLLYTGITRARKMAILIYDRKGLKRAIENNPPNARHRALTDRLKMEMMK